MWQKTRSPRLLTTVRFDRLQLYVERDISLWQTVHFSQKFEKLVDVSEEKQ